MSHMQRGVLVIALGLVAYVCIAGLHAQDRAFAVTLEPPVHGSVRLTPPLPASGTYPAGTVVTVTGVPDKGYVLDSAWYSVPGRFGQMYHEGMTSAFAVRIDQDKRIGASFIEESAVSHIDVRHDVVYAKPGVKPLKYDVYTPKGARNLPIIVIIHGGGWSANDEDIMRGLARELTRGGRFVAVSVDYRWAAKNDGDATNTTMAQIIEDVWGAVAHIMEHATEYGGDRTRIGLTGDSAGGHLAAFASLATDLIGTHGFGKEPGVFEFRPTYVPRNTSVAALRTELTTAIKAAAPSYGVFSPGRLNTYADDSEGDTAAKDAIAPLTRIPNATVRPVPQYLLRGTADRLIPDEAVSEFVTALVKAGQRVEYVQVGGAGHAFFDWKPNPTNKATFAKYGVFHAAQMKVFFESVLY